jgi:hypothetical protein
MDFQLAVSFAVIAYRFPLSADRFSLSAPYLHRFYARQLPTSSDTAAGKLIPSGNGCSTETA